MSLGLALPEEMAEQIDEVLVALCRDADAQCALLADVSGQLISVQGRTQGIDPVLVAALAAGDMSAMAELSRQVGEPDPHGSFLHEGENKNIYLLNVAGSFILIVVFGPEVPVGLVRLFVGRTADELADLTDQFEDLMEQPSPATDADFGAALADELTRVFGEESPFEE
jgi:predicted regulator of Ras-like GTPase activity (Roadblock/LC7/MglB family)